MDEMRRRRFLKNTLAAGAGLITASSIHPFSVPAQAEKDRKRPNVLVAIADDWSSPHAGAYSDPLVQTPAFDRVARDGCLFTQAFVAAPQCSPNRAALLTGRQIWQNEEAGTHSSLFPSKFAVYPDLLEQAGYHVGYTGKPWSPGNWEAGGRKRNPAGPEYNQRKMEPSTSGISSVDYAGNFEDFLQAKPAEAPFCFWYGSHEPHRKYEVDSGLKSGKDLDKVVVPPFLPDTPEIRKDLLDYYLEVEWFDRHLGRILECLEKNGELENTLIVVTGDNGMSFPAAKANLYEYGIHVPLAVCWKAGFNGGRTVKDMIGFVDFAPTFLEAAGLIPPPEMTGRCFLDVLLSNESGMVDRTRNVILSGRERHSHARFDNLGYPARAIRTREYLYIRNFVPERWPAGDPPGYHDIDESPTKTFLIQHADVEEYKNYFESAFSQRPAEELYNIQKDPGCRKNLAESGKFQNPREEVHTRVKHRELRSRLNTLLLEQKDPRVLGTGDIFDSYPRFANMRDTLGGFREQGKYNPKYQIPKGNR
ncbi:MAG TPA: sulfatase [bacterium]|mgnify:CR=1 FL=1|nr:sulfatase [bacterium]